MAQSSSQRKLGLAARRRLTMRQRQRASRRACRRLARLAVFQRARRIGLYRPLASEADPGRLIAAARPGQTFFWPRVEAGQVRYVAAGGHTQRTARSELGPVEPVGGRACSAAALDLLVVPLAAFDAQARRIGLGGGFYDRTLADCGSARRPKLAGLAFEVQRVDAIRPAAWDIAMDWIVSDAGVYRRGPARG